MKFEIVAGVSNASVAFAKYAINTSLSCNLLNKSSFRLINNSLFPATAKNQRKLLNPYSFAFQELLSIL